MKKLVLPILVAFLLTINCKAQLGATFYQSPSYTTVGLMYEFDDVLRSEARFGSDYGLFSASNVIELSLNYDIINKTDFEFYAGVGTIFSEDLGGFIIPIGFNVYPFENKKFGLHIEAATSIYDGLTLLPRWGFRYKLSK